jgi:hypothetical protein
MPVILQPRDLDGWLDGEALNTCVQAQSFPPQLLAVA